MFTDINISFVVDIVKKIFKKCQKQPRKAVSDIFYYNSPTNFTTFSTVKP